MDTAKRLVSSGNGHGTVISAEYQTKGRGRKIDREWTSDRSENLLVTAVLSQSEVRVPIERIPLLAGLAATRTLEAFVGRRGAIKWPNDVVFDGGKVAGVLCESSDDWVYVGVGINCNQDRFPVALRRPATSVLRITGKRVLPSLILEKLLDEMARALNDRGWHEAVESRLLHRGDWITVTLNVEETRNNFPNRDAREYRLRGIGPRGELVVENADGVKTFFAGEIDHAS